MITAADFVDDMYGGILGNFYEFCGLNENVDKSIFNDMVREYIKENKINFVYKHTEASFHATNFLIKNFDIILEKITEIYKAEVREKISYVKSNEMYNKINDIIKDEIIMEVLNTEILESFAFSPIIVSISKIMELLIYRDKETKKHIFSLIIDKKLGETE